jgi:hypothetical protein
LGLFDRWRRGKKDKKAARSSIRGREIYQPTGATKVEKRAMEDLGPVESGEVAKLLADAQRLIHRREELQVERSALLKKLDNAELTATEFRKELMARIQEGAQVSEDLRKISSRLTQLGHPGVAA